VEVELDGQVIQVLGTLQPADRLAGIKVRAGDRVRIEDVDTEQNRCTVSAL
jgi:translation initiation factor IF-1